MDDDDEDDDDDDNSNNNDNHNDTYNKKDNGNDDIDNDDDNHDDDDDGEDDERSTLENLSPAPKMVHIRGSIALPKNWCTLEDLYRLSLGESACGPLRPLPLSTNCQIVKRQKQQNTL